MFITAGHCVDSSTIGHFVSFNYELAATGSAVLPQSHFQVIGIIEDELGGLDYALLHLNGTPAPRSARRPWSGVIPRSGPLSR